MSKYTLDYTRMIFCHGVNQGCASARVNIFRAKFFSVSDTHFVPISLNRIVFGSGFETLWILEASRECSISRLTRILSEYNFIGFPP